MLLLIGGRAAEYVCTDFRDKRAAQGLCTEFDWDFVGKHEDVKAWIKARRDSFTTVYPASRGKKIIARGDNVNCEFEIAWPDSSAEDWNGEWLKKREKETYYYNHPKLGVAKADFFKGDGLTYIYDHDTVHEAVKHLDHPAYTLFKKPGQEVLCDRTLFFAANEEARLYSVLEEAQVLALERSQIPHPGVLTPRQSFEKALMKICTSITSGWWREWAWEHYREVLAMYEEDYVDRFWRAVDCGTVKRCEEKS